MENNQKDFMKNRPVVDRPNQFKDVYGTASTTTMQVLTVILSIIMIVCAVICFCKGHIVPGSIFAVVFAVLILSTYIANRGKKIKYDPDSINQGAIFKDHEL